MAYFVCVEASWFLQGTGFGSRFHQAWEIGVWCARVARQRGAVPCQTINNQEGSFWECQAETPRRCIGGTQSLAGLECWNWWAQFCLRRTLARTLTLWSELILIGLRLDWAVRGMSHVEMDHTCLLFIKNGCLGSSPLWCWRRFWGTAWGKGALSCVNICPWQRGGVLLFANRPATESAERLCLVSQSKGVENRLQET